MHVKGLAEWNAERDALLDALREFAAIMKRRPFDNRQGLRGVSAFALVPALWPVDFRYGDIHLKEAGLGFPEEREFRDVYRDRNWHSYITYVLRT